jgi:hypothetical protein
MGYIGGQKQQRRGEDGKEKGVKKVKRVKKS